MKSGAGLITQVRPCVGYETLKNHSYFSAGRSGRADFVASRSFDGSAIIAVTMTMAAVLILYFIIFTLFVFVMLVRMIPRG